MGLAAFLVVGTLNLSSCGNSCPTDDFRESFYKQDWNAFKTLFAKGCDGWSLFESDQKMYNFLENDIQASLALGGAIEQGLPIKTLDKQGNNLLLLAINNHSRSLFSYLISEGLDPYQKNQKGQAPIDLVLQMDSLTDTESIPFSFLSDVAFNGNFQRLADYCVAKHDTLLAGALLQFSMAITQTTGMPLPELKTLEAVFTAQNFAESTTHFELMSDDDLAQYTEWIIADNVRVGYDVLFEANLHNEQSTSLPTLIQHLHMDPSQRAEKYLAILDTCSRPDKDALRRIFNQKLCI